MGYDPNNPYQQDQQPPYTPPYQQGNSLTPPPPPPNTVYPPQTPYNQPYAYPQSNYPPNLYPPPGQRRRSRAPLFIFIAVLAIIIIVSALAIPNYLNTQHQNNVQATANAQATETISHYPFSSAMLLNDSLASNSKNNWFVNGNCRFQGGSYHVMEPNPDRFYPCTEINQFTKFTYEVTVSNFSGYGAGLIFLSNNPPRSYYLFMIFHDGGYGLYRYDNNALTKTFATGTLDSFSAQIAFTMSVVVHNNAISLFENGHQLKQSDVPVADVLQGTVGVTVASDKQGNAASADFTNAKIWNYGMTA